MRRSSVVSLSFILFLSLFSPTPAHADDKLRAFLETNGSLFALNAIASSNGNGAEAYRHFVGFVTEELTRQGDAATSERIVNGFMAPSNPDFPRSEIAWLTHTYAREVYKDSVIKYTGELIKFKTFATSDIPNRENPEFVRQKEFLRTLAQQLGLGFNDVDGFVQEIWIGEGSESFGLMSHSDVQPVDSTGWVSDPWSGALVDGTIWGRGAIDDKGPIVAVMYGMRALLDSGLPLKKKVILLVGTDEESANEDLDTYLKTHTPPDQTIVVDSNYPVICAEKGWCGAWLELPKAKRIPAGKGTYIVSMNSGFSPSIVPDKAEVKLLVAGPKSTRTQTITLIMSKAREFMATRNGSRLTVGASGDTVIVTSFGKSVHASLPAEGHNALMDLLVFVDRDVRPLKNEYSLLAKFAAGTIGFELDGYTLGLSHHDDFMGDVTVAGNMFHPTDTTVMFMFNFRVPKGVDSLDIERALKKRYEEFNNTYNVKLKTRHYISKALYTDPATPFIQKLLTIYNSVTGESRKAQSIGGGTYAKRLPNAVVFGPAMPDEEYLGHQHNENIKISTLIRNIELLTHTMVEFGM